MACESCGTFKGQGHNFCGVCGNTVESITEEAQQDTLSSIQDPIAEEDLRVWIEQGWAIESYTPCTKCGNSCVCSRTEIQEKQKGYDPGITIGCNPVFLLVSWIIDGIIKICYPPRIETINIDRIICPRCRSEHYENSRIVSERPVR